MKTCGVRAGFLAPEPRYQQTLEVTASKGDPNWKAGTGKALFFKLPNHLARGQANIDVFHEPAMATSCSSTRQVA